MNRNAYKLPVRGTGVGSDYSMADSMRGSMLSGGGDAPPVALPKAMHDTGDRKTFDAVSMCGCLCPAACGVQGGSGVA